MAESESLPWTIFEVGWEQKPGIDDCLHEWRSIPYRTDRAPFVEFEDRCEKCGCPRCPRPGCSERRHHPTVHIFPDDGTFEPVGGYLRP